MPTPFPLPVPFLVDAARGLVLRPWRGADAVSLATAWAVPDIAGQATVPGGGGVGEAERWIRGAAARRELGLSLDLVAGPLSGDEVWGEVGLSCLRLTAGDEVRDEIEIGWWVLPGHRRRGIATAATALLARWAVATLDIERLVARVVRGDVGSETVAHRAGLRHIARLDGTRDLWAGPRPRGPAPRGGADV